MASPSLELVDNSSALVHLPNGDTVIFRLHQYFSGRDPFQKEAFLQPHQDRTFVIIVDDCAKYHMGTVRTNSGQYIKVGGEIFNIHFDRWKCYFRITKLTVHDLLKYRVID